MKPLSVQEYLWEPAKYPAKPICIVFGDESFLRSVAVRHIRDQVLAAEDAEFALCQFEGDDITIKDVLGGLQTAAMFGGGRRVVRVDDADSFVTKNRAALENYAGKPSEQSVLILQLKSFPATTNFYKKIAASGLLIEAKTLSEKEMPQWVARWSMHQHKTVCDRTAAEMIVQRIGMEHGLLDQELSKLSLMVTDSKKGITLELVEQAVGSWRVRKVYDMLDLALAGKTAAAMHQLNVLLTTDKKKDGNDAIGILNMISASLRKMAMATELVLDGERRKKPISLRSALMKAKVENWLLGKTESQLRHLGSRRGAKLSSWLLQLDLDLKGASRSDPRLLVEMFIIRLASAK